MKTAVITGASGGIGSATALAFAKDGYNVVLQYNNSQDKALALAKKIENETNSTALPVKADVSSSQEVTFLFDEVENRFGNVDVLVNNAGIAQQKLFTDITDEDWRRMTGTNLAGVYEISRGTETLYDKKSQRGYTKCQFNVGAGRCVLRGALQRRKGRRNRTYKGACKGSRTFGYSCQLHCTRSCDDRYDEIV